VLMGGGWAGVDMMKGWSELWAGVWWELKGLGWRWGGGVGTGGADEWWG